MSRGVSSFGFQRARPSYGGLVIPCAGESYGEPPIARSAASRRVCGLEWNVKRPGRCSCTFPAFHLSKWTRSLRQTPWGIAQALFSGDFYHTLIS